LGIKEHLVARLLIKIDVRGRAAFLAKLCEQHEARKMHGEISYLFNVDDNARNIGYVFLEWQSLQLLNVFYHSPESRLLLGEWPVEKILEVIRLREVDEELEAQPSIQEGLAQKRASPLI
jgi:hypothetical protein